MKAFVFDLSKIVEGPKILHGSISSIAAGFLSNFLVLLYNHIGSNFSDRKQCPISELIINKILVVHQCSSGQPVLGSFFVLVMDFKEGYAFNAVFLLFLIRVYPLGHRQ